MSCINDTCDIFDADDFMIDIDELSFHIRNIDSYYNRLKWLSQETIIEKRQTNEIVNNHPNEFISQPQTQDESLVSLIIRKNSTPSFNQFNTNQQNPFVETNTQNFGIPQPFRPSIGVEINSDVPW
jgi:hypothetical protein